MPPNNDLRGDDGARDEERVLSMARIGLTFMFDPRVQKTYEDLIALADSLRARLATAERDAARYRFLRDGEYPEPVLLMLRAAGIHRCKVDDAVDAAMAVPCETCKSQTTCASVGHCRRDTARSANGGKG